MRTERISPSRPLLAPLLTLLLVIGGAIALSAPAAGALIPLDAQVNGVPMCADAATATRVRLALRPKSAIDPASISVDAAPWVVTNVDGAPNAWIVHLKGPRTVPATGAVVSASVDGAPDAAVVDIPGFVCGTDTEISGRVSQQPMCADGRTATRVRIALRPKAGVDPNSVTVTGGVMTLTNVDSAPDAWIVHLKGPADLPAQTVTVHATLDGIPQSVDVDIPAFSCSPPARAATAAPEALAVAPPPPTPAPAPAAPAAPPADAPTSEPPASERLAPEAAAAPAPGPEPAAPGPAAASADADRVGRDPTRVGPSDPSVNAESVGPSTS